jgi:hypothetical protein
MKLVLIGFEQVGNSALTFATQLEVCDYCQFVQNIKLIKENAIEFNAVETYRKCERKCKVILLVVLTPGSEGGNQTISIESEGNEVIVVI